MRVCTGDVHALSLGGFVGFARDGFSDRELPPLPNRTNSVDASTNALVLGICLSAQLTSRQNV